MHEAQHSENSNDASRDGGGSRQLLGSFFAGFWLEIYDFDHIFGCASSPISRNVRSSVSESVS